MGMLLAISIYIYTHEASGRDASSSVGQLPHTGESMVTYPPDSPSRMCDASLDEASLIVDTIGMRTYAHASQAAYPRVHTPRRRFGPRVAHCPEAPHTSASSMLPSPLPTRMSLHHLTPWHMSHFAYLLLDVQRLSRCPLSSARHGASGRPCALFPHPPHSNTNVCICHPMLLACRRTALDTGSIQPMPSALGKSHYGPQCAHTDDTAAPSSSGDSISTRH
jgi:hypothetical protein